MVRCSFRLTLIKEVTLTGFAEKRPSRRCSAVHARMSIHDLHDGAHLDEPMSPKRKNKDVKCKEAVVAGVFNEYPRQMLQPKENVYKPSQHMPNLPFHPMLGTYDRHC